MGNLGSALRKIYDCRVLMCSMSEAAHRLPDYKHKTTDLNRPAV